MSIDVEQLQTALSGGQQSIAALLSENPNPVIRLLAERWSQSASEVEADEAPPVVDRSDRLLRKRLARLESELELRDDFLSALACALGACEQCWGEDTLCGECHGRGRPAWRMPEREQFERFIAPAARRLASAQRAARKSPVPAVQRDPQPKQPSTGEMS